MILMVMLSSFTQAAREIDEIHFVPCRTLFSARTHACLGLLNGLLLQGFLHSCKAYMKFPYYKVPLLENINRPCFLFSSPSKIKIDVNKRCFAFYSDTVNYVTC